MKILDGKADIFKGQRKRKSKSWWAKEIWRWADLGCYPSWAKIKHLKTYVRAKEKACNEYGIKSVAHRLSENTTQNELLALINVLNLDDSIHGILVQLPLPKHIDTDAILAMINPAKDVDGFHAVNVGKLVSGLDGFVPCTPLGVMKF